MALYLHLVWQRTDVKGLIFKLLYFFLAGQLKTNLMGYTLILFLVVFVWNAFEFNSYSNHESVSIDSDRSIPIFQSCVVFLVCFFGNDTDSQEGGVLI